jgi:hypothetical protein
MLPANKITRKAYEVAELPEDTETAKLLKRQTCVMTIWGENKHWTYFAVRGKFSNKCHDVVLPIKFSVFSLRYSMWVGGTLAQEAFDMLSSSMREFVMTGTTEEEWNEMMGTEQEE